MNVMSSMNKRKPEKTEDNTNGIKVDVKYQDKYKKQKYACDVIRENVIDRKIYGNYLWGKKKDKCK